MNVEEEIEEKKVIEPKLKKEEIYPKFLSLLIGLLDGSIDTPTFECDCEKLLGYQSFVFHTLDKLIAMIQRQVKRKQMINQTIFKSYLLC